MSDTAVVREDGTTKSSDTVALVALLRRANITWSGLAERLEEAGSAERLLEATASERLFAPDGDDELRDAERDLAAWQAEGIHVLSVLDAAYPDNLRTVYDRPAVLFVQGGLEASDERSVAVVGTRRPTPRGSQQSADAARALVDAGYVVLSGLAAGIDTAAHTAALEAGGRTVAVIGTGLRRTYPRENAALQRHLATEHAVVSQFLPDQPPQRQTFPQRNAVMSGLARATLIIEAGATSGTRIHARAALAHGRPLFLLRAVLEHPWARELAERPGVRVVDGAPEVVAELDRLAAPELAPA